MSTKMIVLVDDKETEGSTEMTVVDTAEQAERLVETLLEAGYAAQRVRIFAATQNEFVTTYRPVVSFVAEDETPAAKYARRRTPAAASSRTERLSSPFHSARDGRLLTACEAAA